MPWEGENSASLSLRHPRSRCRVDSEAQFTAEILASSQGNVECENSPRVGNEGSYVSLNICQP